MTGTASGVIAVENRHGWRGLAGAVAAALLGALALMPSGAFAGACPASITTCPCTIKTPGSYKVANDITLPSASNCINIAAKKVFLDLGGFTLTGKSAGIGINILSTSGNVGIVGGTVEHFGNGVVADAPAVALVEVTSASNVSNGMVFNAPGNLVSGSSYLNGKNGIVVTSLASGTALVHAEVEDNGSAGVRVNGAGSFFSFGSVGMANGTFGFWLRGSSNGAVLSSYAESNGVAGIYLGCSLTGPDAATCASLGLTPANDNNILQNYINNTASQKYGIAVDRGNLRNHILLNNNGGYANITDDLIDENPTCGSNVWSANTFTNSSPGLDAVSPFCIN